MSRDGSGVYTKPFPDVVGSTTIASAVYNGFVNDVAADLNAARPIVAGGTGANNAGTALFNLGAEASTQIVTNFDTQVWVPGTFFAATTASGSPVGGHAFSGQAYIAEALANPPTNANVTVTARDATTGLVYVRIKTANVWGAWALSTAATDAAIAAAAATANAALPKAGGTMTGALTLVGDPGAALQPATKQYADAISTAFAAADTTLTNNKVAKGGDTMTGLLTLSGNPSTALQAATKQYVDVGDVTRSYLAGLTLSTAGSSSTFGIAAGVAADSTNAAMMALASAYTKTTGAWAVGSGNGAMDTGSVAASTWYHVHLIKRLDTGVVDVLFSLSATAPTLPTNYTVFRRIGSITTDGSSQWRKFIQNGDEFNWDVSLSDANNTATSSTPALLTLSVPSGVIVNADLFVEFGAATATQLLIYDPARSAQTANTPAGNVSVLASQNSIFDSSPVRVFTDTSSRVRYVSGLAGNMFVVTRGWTDTRGRLS